MTNHFTFFASYYEAVEHLDADTKAEFFDLLFKYALRDEEPTDTTTPIAKALFMMAKPNLDSSKAKREAGKAGGKQSSSKRKQTTSKPKQTPSDKEKEKEIGVGDRNTNLNAEAFKEWCQYKGSKFKAVSKTKAINQLVKHSKHIQREMIDSSIANGWAGLFEPKQQTSFKGKAPQVGSLEWERQQMMGNQGVVDAELI